MLLYELDKARNAVEKAKEAVSAVEQAKAMHQPVDEAHAAHVLDRSLVNLAYQRIKIGKLDGHGQVVLDKGQGTIAVSEQVRKDSRAKTVVSSGAASSFEPLPKPAYAAARQAPPAPEADPSAWYRALENYLPAAAAACAAAVAPQASDSKEPPIEEDSTGRVQAFTRKPQEQAHAAASDSSGASAGSGAPLPEAIDAVASAFASAVGEAPAANMPTKVNEDVALPLAAVGEAPAANMPTKVNEDVALPLAEERPRHIPPPFVRPSSCCWCMLF